MEFLSTPSARRATAGWAYGLGLRYISIHALREEGDTALIGGNFPRKKISIHALREEGDPPERTARETEQTISIHALREEGDAFPALRARRGARFLSTPSARRATAAGREERRLRADFYPRPPRGGRLLLKTNLLLDWLIFLSTPSARRATQKGGIIWRW